MMAVPVRGWVVDEASTNEDLDAVLEIEHASFENPWTREMLSHELRNRPVSRIYLLREAPSGPVMAFCSVWVVLDEMHVNNLAVRPEHRRRGAGRALMEAVLERAAEAGCRLVVLEVRRSNLPAQALYEGLGFVLMGVRKNYYTKPDEDALVLGKKKG